MWFLHKHDRNSTHQILFQHAHSIPIAPRPIKKAANEQATLPACSSQALRSGISLPYALTMIREDFLNMAIIGLFESPHQAPTQTLGTPVPQRTPMSSLDMRAFHQQTKQMGPFTISTVHNTPPLINIKLKLCAFFIPVDPYIGQPTCTATYVWWLNNRSWEWMPKNWRPNLTRR